MPRIFSPITGRLTPIKRHVLHTRLNEEGALNNAQINYRYPTPPILEFFINTVIPLIISYSATHVALSQIFTRTFQQI